MLARVGSSSWPTWKTSGPTRGSGRLICSLRWVLSKTSTRLPCTGACSRSVVYTHVPALACAMLQLTWHIHTHTQQLTTMGYGDVVPRTAAEQRCGAALNHTLEICFSYLAAARSNPVTRCCCCCAGCGCCHLCHSYSMVILFAGSILFAYTIAQMTGITTRQNSKETAYGLFMAELVRCIASQHCVLPHADAAELWWRTCRTLSCHTMSCHAPSSNECVLTTRRAGWPTHFTGQTRIL